MGEGCHRSQYQSPDGSGIGLFQYVVLIINVRSNGQMDRFHVKNARIRFYISLIAGCFNTDSCGFCSAGHMTLYLLAVRQAASMMMLTYGGGGLSMSVHGVANAAARNVACTSVIPAGSSGKQCSTGRLFCAQE
jgi:hypothetical protein